MLFSFSRYYILLFLFISPLLYAQSFDGIGIVNKVIAEEGIVVVNETKFFLSTNVYDSSNDNGQPAINVLKKGTEIGFSGVESTPYDRITSVNIHKQPE